MKKRSGLALTPTLSRSTGRGGNAWHKSIELGALFLLVCIAAGPSTQPASGPSPDAALWKKLDEIDAKAGEIKRLSANFEQEKHTALLRKPLVSSGRVRINGDEMRWETQQPQQSVLLIDAHEAKMYYPEQKTLEIYPLDKRLAELAASPLPRLAVLKDRFAIGRMAIKELDPNASPAKYLALRLVPTDPELLEHVREIRVLLDISSAYIVKAEVTDSDGDRTVLSFKDVQVNMDVGELKLTVPSGTVVTHPLEGLDGQAAEGSSKSR